MLPLKPFMPACRVHDLGTIDYLPAWELQNRLAAEVARAERPATLLLLEHPHTYTFGRRGQIENLLWDEQTRQAQGVALHWVDRGGDVTYHGPGQLVGYPILKLDGTDHVGYVRALERALILALARLDVDAFTLPGLTGVWVRPPGANRVEEKIAAIGVKVDAQNVTRHGFALNVETQMRFFEGIIPCGIRDHPAARIADLVQPVPAMEHVKDEVARAFGEIFRLEIVQTGI